MAITVTHLFEDDTTTNGTSWTTGSQTPTSGELTIIAVNTHGAVMPEPTLSGTNGWNVTWTNRVSFQAEGNRITLFTGIPSSGTAGTLTVDTGSDSQGGFIISANKVTGDPDTTTPFVQTGTGTASSGTVASLDSPLSAFASGSVSFLCVMFHDSNPAFTPEGSWSLLGTGTGHATPSRGSVCADLNGEDTTPTITNDQDQNWAIVGVEIGQAAGGGPTGFTPRSYPRGANRGVMRGVA